MVWSLQSIISLNGVVVYILEIVLGGVRLAEHSDERLLGVLVLNERVDADNILRLTVVGTLIIFLTLSHFLYILYHKNFFMSRKPLS